MKLTQHGAIVFNGSVCISSPSAGILTFNNDCWLVGFTFCSSVATTSSFPAIKRNGTAINFRLADDSADAAITALTIQSTQTTGTAPFTVASTTIVPNLNASSLNGATFASPGAIGGTTASTGAFTTLSASSTVSGTGFSTYLASPPAIGGTAAAAVTGTTVRANTSFSANGTAGVSAGSFTAITGIQSIDGIVTTLTGTGSDERLKTDIQPYEGGLAELVGLAPVRYHYNEVGSKFTGIATDHDEIGFNPCIPSIAIEC